MAYPSKVIFLRNYMTTLYDYPDKCRICGRALDEKNTVFSTHSPVRLYPCRHVFGKECLVDLLNRTENPDHNKCPMCKKKLFEKDVQVQSSTTNTLRRSPATASRHTSPPENSSVSGLRTEGPVQSSYNTDTSSSATITPSRYTFHRENERPSGSHNISQGYTSYGSSTSYPLKSSWYESIGVSQPSSSARNILYTDSRRNPNIIPSGRGPPPPLEEREIWTSSGKRSSRGPSWFSSTR